MSKVKGVLLVMAGLGVAAYVLSTRAEFAATTTSQHPDSARSPAAAAPVRVAAAEPSQRPDRRRDERRPAVREPQPERPPPVQDTTPEPATAAAPPSHTWPPFVTRTDRDSAPSRLPLSPPHRAVGVFTDRVSLARDLQRELRRVGCYDGEINGVWTTSTRRAMKAFTDRVNATLPLEEPDHVLLALVRNHPDSACDKPCPAGQGLSEAGRCLPIAMLARAAATKGSAHLSAGTAPKGMAPQPQPAIVIGRSTSTTEPPPEGRMALAGPRTDGRPAVPASPMRNEGVSLLAGPEGEGGRETAAPPTAGNRAYREAEKPRRSSWARTFWRRRDPVF
jgi:hypothetical protein